MYSKEVKGNTPSSVQNDMEWSAKLFCDNVWPIIREHLDGGDLMKMEGRPDVELAKQLDMKAGIDGWHLHKTGMRGIASRIQETTRPWNTFTVRMSRHSGAITEFEKRKNAILESKRGWIFPAITVQAYAHTKQGPIIACGIAKTADIIDFIEKGLHYTKPTTNAWFAVCGWDKMKRNGYKVKIIN